MKNKQKIRKMNVSNQNFCFHLFGFFHNTFDHLENLIKTEIGTKFKVDAVFQAERTLNIF